MPQLELTLVGILNITPYQELETTNHLGKKLKVSKEKIAFDDNNLERMIQLHDDVLPVALKIGGFLMKKVMINHGNGAKIIYLNLYIGLGLKEKYLTKYNTPLVGFDGNMVMLMGQILLPVVTKRKEVMVNFTVVHAFSPYTAILT